MTRTQERYYPIAAGPVAGVIFYAGQQHYLWTPPASLPNLLSSTINVCAISIGFLGTAQSIIVSMEDRPVIQQLKEAGTLKRIVEDLLSAIVWSFWLACISALLMLFDWTAISTTATTRPTLVVKPFAWVPVLLGLWVALLTTSGLAYYRIISLFAGILKAGSSSTSRN